MTECAEALAQDGNDPLGGMAIPQLRDAPGLAVTRHNCPSFRRDPAWVVADQHVRALSDGYRPFRVLT